MEVTIWSEALWCQRGRLGRLSEHAGRNARERRAGLETGDAGADPPEKWGRPELEGGSERRVHPFGPAGVVTSARMEEEEGGKHGKPCRRGGIH